ncbi:MAG: alkaline phosphatase [Cyclobacteriaceae bacterium]|nr:alkaline phosphatase [Cyclobacteriaceae bacterium]
MKNPLIYIIFILTGLLTGCQSAVNTDAPAAGEKEVAKKPKNIILLIGDGMGVSQVSASFYWGDGNPNFQRFQQIGLIKTNSSRQKVTDSAAGATAFASGEKTYNGAIGVADDTTSIKTILEIASEGDKSTGVVATSTITHATPAAFYAHIDSRGKQEGIAEQLVTSSVDYFAGGGGKFFFNRSDGKDLMPELQENGFIIDTTQLAPSVEFGKKYGFLLAADGMPRMLDGRGDFLPRATQQALEYLSQDEEGFFLMVEASQIDWAGHANDAEYVKTEVLDFDQVIGIALDFAEKEGNTLVVVTADHETGGYSLTASSKTNADGTTSSNYAEIGPTFSTGGHSATLIPVFAHGPGAESFSGIYENTDIFHKMKALAGW